jgi:hypothetical protein
MRHRTLNNDGEAQGRPEDMLDSGPHFPGEESSAKFDGV